METLIERAAPPFRWAGGCVICVIIVIEKLKPLSLFVLRRRSFSAACVISSSRSSDLRQDRFGIRQVASLCTEAWSNHEDRVPSAE
jgi:hypothetical protein